MTLGQQNGLIVPLIAIHLFVFCFGIMADVTPPVARASFAAAVSGGDPIWTGVVAFFYSLRTAALPFLFIFNTDLMLINVDIWHGACIFVVATIAMLLFAAAMQGRFLVRSRFLGSAALLLVAFTLFSPGFWMDMIFPPFTEVPPAQLATAAATPAGEHLRLRIADDQIGELIDKLGRAVEAALGRACRICPGAARLPCEPHAGWAGGSAGSPRIWLAAWA